MQFLKVFHVSLYALVFAASGILAAAEGGFSPALATFALGLAAFYFNDRRAEFGLSDYWANALAVAAFCIAAIEFDGNDRESQLLSGTHLLVYLLWIVLLWQRELRHYWYICALCLLQVAVASILTQAGWFGLALVGYIALAIWTFALFSMLRAELAVNSPETEKGFLAQWLPWFSTSSSQTTTSRVRGHLQEGGRNFVELRLVLGLLLVAVASVSAGSLVYVMIPRTWEKRPEISLSQSRTNRRATAGPSVTGFTETVRLGDIGEILESSDPVLTMRMWNQNSQPVDILEYAGAHGMSEPYLRGAVLVNYNSKENTWRPSTASNIQRQLIEPMSATPSKYTKQEFALEPLGSGRLFAMRPYISLRRVYGEVIGGDGQMYWEMPDLTLTRTPESGRVQYQVTTFEPERRRPDLYDLTPFDLINNPVFRRELTQGPGPRLRRLATLAKRIEAQLDVDDLSHGERAYAVARALESHLRDSGEYGYTLDASVQDPHIDPLEDFLFNRKSGHCEYYASALTLMLRSVGIPAQMVNGFKGGDYDEGTHTLYVEQRHAHSWVEAFVNGQWLIMDPTPAGERQKIVVANQPGGWESLNRRLWRFWNENILGISMRQQRRRLFDPMLKSLQKAFSSTEGMREAVGEFWGWIVETIRSPRRWFSVDGGLVAFVLLATPVLLFRLVRRIWRYFRGRNRRKASRAAAGRIEFYERFKTLAQSCGLVREPQQTQREFGEDLQQSLNEVLSHPELDDLGDSVAESFYRVRFGSRELTQQEEHLIDKKLELFETAVRRKS